MIAESGSQPARCCDRHKWYRVADIGGWMVRRGGSDLILVTAWAQIGGIWRPGHCELTHQDLTARVQAAGRIACSHALKARALLSGEIELVNGLHRWVVASELGISVVPVKMTIEIESPWAWEPGVDI